MRERKERIHEYLSAWGSDRRVCLKILPSRKNEIYLWKIGNKSWDVLGDSRKRYHGLWAEVGKYWPGKEPTRLQDSLPCPLKKTILKYWLILQEICKSHNRMVLRTHYRKKKNRSLIGQINFTFQQMIFCTLTCLNCVWSGSEIKSNQILRLKKITNNNIFQVNFYK